MVIAGAARAGGAVHRDMDLVDGRHLEREIPGEQAGQAWRERGTDHERRAVRRELVIERHQLAGVVEAVTDGDDRGATQPERPRQRRMIDRVSEHGDVAVLDERRRFAARVVRSDVDVGEHPLHAATDDAGRRPPRSSFGGPASVGSSRGRHPPCCGGVPPRPRTLSPAAAIPAMVNAPRMRRSSFMAADGIAGRRRRRERPNIRAAARLLHPLATVRPMPVPEPPRPSAADVERELADHVRALAGPDAVPRADQIAAVTAVVADRRRTLLVARTGFGKSAVYFSATRMLRDRGWGPTVVVSPLLALMRDQVAAAERLGLVAVTINSSNIDSWAEMEERIGRDEVDLLLIAPERLANAGFRRRVFDTMQTRAFALVCDEAHCISDWGHDFRPDYRRLRRLLAELPPWTPVLATTATANQRVTDDVAAQLGDDTLVLRTPLDRASLHLSVVDLPDDSHRLAWLAETLGDIPGSGIIYCLTVDQADTTAAWLRSRGHDVAAYTGSVEPERTARDGVGAARERTQGAGRDLGVGHGVRQG